MNIHYRICGLNNKGGLEPLIEKDLHDLSQLIPISQAEIVLEKQIEAAPPFVVSALLAVPGPDIHAVACDHTLMAAWQKLLEDLKKQFQRRVKNRDLHTRDREQLHSVDRQRTGAV